MSTAARPLGKAVYTATEDDRLWLQSVQRKLYARSRENPDYQFEELWGLVTDPRNLRIALSRVQRNRGARTAGVDRVTVRQVLQRGADDFLAAVRRELRGGSFHPSPKTRSLQALGNPDRDRPSGSSGNEAGAGADLRSGVLPYFVRLSTWSFRLGCTGAFKNAAAPARNDSLEEGRRAAVPVGYRGRYQGML